MIPDAPEILRKMKITAGARFIASRRLQLRDEALTRLTSLSSAYVIVLTMLPYVCRVGQRDADHITLITLATAIVVLVSSLVQYSSKDTVNSEQLHRSALEINELYRKWTSSGLEDGNPEIKLSNKYNLVLQKYSINHDELDYKLYLARRPEESKWLSPFDRWWIKVYVQFSAHLTNIALALVTTAFLYITIRYGWQAEIHPSVVPASAPILRHP